MRILGFLMLVATIVGCAAPDEALPSSSATVITTTLTSPPATQEPSPTSQAINPATTTLEPQTTPTLTADMESYDYVPVTEFSLEHYIESVTWEAEGRLIYAIQGTWATSTPYFEPKDWSWWQFDPATRENMPLTPPGTEIVLEARQELGVCADWPPEETSTDGCAGPPILYESPYGDRVIYNPISRGETTWMAHKNGSDVMRLEGVLGAPQNANWSSDGRWVIVSIYAYGTPGMEIHYLVNTNEGTVQQLDLLTGHLLTFVSYLRPQFSPDGRYLVYAATDNPDYELESEYGLYLMDMNTLQSERLSDRFGPFQWDTDSQGLVVLDNAVVFGSIMEGALAPRKAALFHLDISNKPFLETLLFDHIDFYPNDSPSLWHWAYSPENQAIAYVGLRPENELGILFLSP